MLNIDGYDTTYAPFTENIYKRDKRKLTRLLDDLNAHKDERVEIVSQRLAIADWRQMDPREAMVNIAKQVQDAKPETILLSTGQRISGGDMMRDGGGVDGEQGVGVQRGSGQCDLGSVSAWGVVEGD